jgi:alcohol dehydrogenase
LGAAHAAANPLTAHYGIAHGRAIGLMLGAVVRFNAEDPAVRVWYEELSAGSIDQLNARLDALLEVAKMPSALSQCGVERSAIPLLAAEAAKQWTAAFNPRTIAESDFIRLFESVFDPC